MKYCSHLLSPIGLIRITSDDLAITGIEFVSKSTKDTPGPLTTMAVHQLLEYFEGKRKTFSLPLAYGGTRFQHQVWDALATIPYGEAVSYAQVARKLRNPKACRAVGTANGKNPISIVLPCHRVIAADGTLGGYTGGLAKKRFLLALEGISYKEK
ncbi:MAG: methylated-DNA--[protein]-cysteine S-methyltransferase [Anaerovoracaceae bacterium]